MWFVFIYFEEVLSLQLYMIPLQIKSKHDHTQNAWVVADGTGSLHDEGPATTITQVRVTVHGVV